MLKDIKCRYLNFKGEISSMKDRVEKFKKKVLKTDPFSALLTPGRVLFFPHV